MVLSDDVVIQERILKFLKERGRAFYVDCLTKKLLGFSWSKKVKITFETVSFWHNTFFQYFPIFSILVLYNNESLPMKSYHFFKIYNRF